MMQSRSVKIDTEEFTALWLAGVARREIGKRFGCSPASVTRWSVLLGLEARPRGIRPGQVRPVIAPKAKGEPTYHPGLSAAVQRAKEKGAERGDTAKRINWVATSYRVPYRDVLAMAGVAG